MDENDLLEMGRTLTEKYKKFEMEKKIFEDRMINFQKYMLVGSDNTFPLVIKFMIERLRGITSHILFRDTDEEAEDFNLFL